MFFTVSKAQTLPGASSESPGTDERLAGAVSARHRLLGLLDGLAIQGLLV